MTDNADSDGSGTTASTTTTENSPLCPQKKTSSYGGASLKSSPANSPSIGRGTRISSTGNLRRASRRRGSGDADDGSVFSSFTSTSKPIISRQSFVLAPDDVDLPPQTRKLYAKYTYPCAHIICSYLMLNYMLISISCSICLLFMRHSSIHM